MAPIGVVGLRLRLIIVDFVEMWFIERDDEWLQIIDLIDQTIWRLETCILTCKDFLTNRDQFVIYEFIDPKFPI